MNELLHQARQYELEARALWLERLHLLSTSSTSPCADQAEIDQLKAKQEDAEYRAMQCRIEAEASTSEAEDDYIDPATVYQYL